MIKLIFIYITLIFIFFSNSYGQEGLSSFTSMERISQEDLGNSPEADRFFKMTKAERREAIEKLKGVSEKHKDMLVEKLESLAEERENRHE